jgi:hypothetical protein
MRIVGASSSISSVRRQVTDGLRDTPSPEAPRDALITIEPARRSEQAWRPSSHPAAPFVAHLIATRMQVPQTRERRRAEPNEAIAVYRSMTKPVAEKRVFGTRV